MGFSKSKQASNNTSQQTSTSSNQAFPFLQQAFGGQTALTGQGTSAIASLLGLNGPEALSTGFKQFKDSSGYNFIRDEALRGVTANKAFQGLLGSGSALKGAMDRTGNIADQFLNSYLSQLSGLANTGLSAGQIIGGAGNQSQSQGTSTGTSKGSSMGFQLG